LGKKKPTGNYASKGLGVWRGTMRSKRLRKTSLAKSRREGCPREGV